MYRVIIVEDEIIVREWLKKRVNWQACGFSVCGEASNGREALSLYEREKPDVVLTDMRMPVMDGMTLLRSIREQDKRVRFLILTSGETCIYERCRQGFQILKLAQEKFEKEEIKKLQAMLYTLACKFLKEEGLIRLKEAIDMTVLGQMLMNDGIG